MLVCASQLMDTLSVGRAIDISKKKFLADLPDAPQWFDGSGLTATIWRPRAASFFYWKKSGASSRMPVSSTFSRRAARKARCAIGTNRSPAGPPGSMRKRGRWAGRLLERVPDGAVGAGAGVQFYAQQFYRPHHAVIKRKWNGCCGGCGSGIENSIPSTVAKNHAQIIDYE